MDSISIKQKSWGDTNPGLKMVNFVFRWPLVTLNMGQSENFKSMTHLLYIMHLHTKIEMDPIIIKQKSVGGTRITTQTDRQTDVYCESIQIAREDSCSAVYSSYVIIINSILSNSRAVCSAQCVHWNLSILWYRGTFR